MKVIILSPNVFSLYTICALNLFMREGVTVSGVVTNRLINPYRFRMEFRRNGMRFIRKIYRKLILRSAENATVGDINILTFMKEAHIERESVKRFCKRYGIPICATNDFNTPAVTRFVESKAPDCIAFTGGGLIKQELLNLPMHGVINCHMGILPEYRGMDVVQWAVLQRDFEGLGITAHRMDAGIDTGPIIDRYVIPSDDYQSLAQLRNAIEAKMPEFLVDACIRISNSQVEARHQNKKDGKQYFRMHESLVPHVEAVLRNRFLKKT